MPMQKSKTRRHAALLPWIPRMAFRSSPMLVVQRRRPEPSMRIWQPFCLITTSTQPPRASKSMRSNPRPQQARLAVGQAAAPDIVVVRTGVEARAVSRAGDQLHVSGSASFEQDCEIVLVAVNVKPNARLVAEAGIQIGTKGALQVNRRVETAIPDIYAGGDCVETWHRVVLKFWGRSGQRYQSGLTPSRQPFSTAWRSRNLVTSISVILHPSAARGIRSRWPRTIGRLPCDRNRWRQCAENNLCVCTQRRTFADVGCIL
jgi:Pyridine nucleotide-disulphide oxidoreductase